MWKKFLWPKLYTHVTRLDIWYDLYICKKIYIHWCSFDCIFGRNPQTTVVEKTSNPKDLSHIFLRWNPPTVCFLVGQAALPGPGGYGDAYGYAPQRTVGRPGVVVMQMKNGGRIGFTGLVVGFRKLLRKHFYCAWDEKMGKLLSGELAKGFLATTLISVL